MTSYEKMSYTFVDCFEYNYIVISSINCQFRDVLRHT